MTDEAPELPNPSPGDEDGHKLKSVDDATTTSEPTVPQTCADRQSLYEQGQSLLSSGDRPAALKAFLRSLDGLQPGAPLFPGLPFCLRAVATCHYEEGNFGQAVHFIQAEKLFYENALLESGILQSRMNIAAASASAAATATGKAALDMPVAQDEDSQLARATEFETLGRFCLDRQQPQLALEYCAKATQLRKELLGEEHRLVKESLDLMALVYAEQGKSEYCESLRNFESAAAAEKPASILKSPKTSVVSGAALDVDANGSLLDASAARRVRFDEATLTEAARVKLQDESVPGLRRRKVGAGGVANGASAGAVSPAAEELISRTLLLLLFLLCGGALLGLTLYAYCNVATQVAPPPGPPLCRQLELLPHSIVAAVRRLDVLWWTRTATE